MEHTIRVLMLSLADDARLALVLRLVLLAGCKLGMGLGLGFGDRLALVGERARHEHILRKEHHDPVLDNSSIGAIQVLEDKVVVSVLRLHLLSFCLA